MLLIKSYRKGVSLVEAIIALLILSATSASIILFMVQISAANNSARLRNQASSYAEQGMEQVRGLVQTTGWANVAPKASAACYSDGTLSTGGFTCINNCAVNEGSLILSTIFYRSVKVTTTGDQIAVVSSVCWQEKGKWNKTVSSTYFYSY